MDELTAEELRDPVIAALHHAWCAALDTTNSPDFRETHERCGECDQATGQLQEEEYLRLQGRRIRRAAAELRTALGVEVPAEPTPGDIVHIPPHTFTDAFGREVHVGPSFAMNASKVTEPPMS